MLDDSPAGLNGTLHTGDRILAVDDIDLTNASHDKAVQVIRNSKSIVSFLVQSLLINNYIPNLNEASNPLDDNPYGYSVPALQEKYSGLMQMSGHGDEQQPQIFVFKLTRAHANESLGLSLSGNTDLNKTSVFVCDILPDTLAHKHGMFKIGDQLLEINGKSIYGRAHSNVSPIIRSIKDLAVYLVILRHKENLKQMFTYRTRRDELKYNFNDDGFSEESNSENCSSRSDRHLTELWPQVNVNSNTPLETKVSLATGKEPKGVRLVKLKKVHSFLSI